MNLSVLPPSTRKAFLAVVRQFAVDIGIARVHGLEFSEQMILEMIDKGIIKMHYDQAKGELSFDVPSCD